MLCCRCGCETEWTKFVDESLAAGQPVLIHCLAGAHRAGTAGIACLMHLCDLDAKPAIATAKLARPAINPIGDFPNLLKLLQTARRSLRAASNGGGGSS